MQITVQTWNYPPVVPATSTHTVRNRSDLAINLSASDVNQKQFIGVYITALPTKGTLYQRLADGSRGAVIDKLYSAYTRSVPTYQYGMKVINVSSTWGNSKDYSPSHALGPQDCNIYGDCAKAWCPQTADGDGGLANGTTKEGYKFRNNPDTDFNLFGYTEYLELQYNQSVYVSEMLIGENWGMGAVKNILAKDFLGNWMTLYTAIVDGTIEALFDKFAQYRKIRTFQDYVLASQTEPLVEHYSRMPEGTWLYRALGPGERLVLPSLGCDIAVERLYVKVFRIA